MMKPTIAWIAVAATLGSIAVAGSAAAQPTGNIVIAQATEPAPSPIRAHRRPTRITVYPTGRYYRECTDWYELQHRPSGDVIYPQMSCRWVAR